MTLIALLSYALRFLQAVANVANAHTITNIPVYSFQRQRSISLSSLDSENELELDGKSCTGPVGVSNRACRSQTSTHSLNEADLVQVITEISPREIAPFLSIARARTAKLHSEFFFDRANIRR